MASFCGQSNWISEATADEKNPQWLELFLGESPFFSSSQCRFIANVRSRIMKNARSSVQTSDNQILEIKQNARSMKKSFKMVVQQLSISSSSKQRFKREYPQWRSYRDMNVRRLKEIADSIDNDRQNCQVSKVIGSSMALFGGGMCLAAAEKEDRTPQTIGSVLKGLGTLVSAGTSLVEEILLQVDIDKAKRIMQLDEKHMKSLVAWVDNAECLKSEMENIQSSNKSLQRVAERFQEVSEKYFSRRERENEIQMILKSFNCPAELRKEISDIIGILMASSMLFDRYSSLFDAALNSCKVMSQLRLSADLFRAAYNGASTVDTFNKRRGLTQDEKKAVAKGMALDAANIMLVFMEDPSSVQGREIRNVADELEREAYQFEKLYNEMNLFGIQEY